MDADARTAFLRMALAGCTKQCWYHEDEPACAGGAVTLPHLKQQDGRSLPWQRAPMTPTRSTDHDHDALWSLSHHW